MSGQFKLLEKYISTGGVTGTTYFSLSSDRPSLLTRVQFRAINVVESMNHLTPIITITFIDSDGSIMDGGKIDYSAEYYIDIGPGPFDTKTSIPLRLSSVDFGNEGSKASGFSNIAVKLTFVDKNWDISLNKKFNRGWSGKSYTDIVQTIAKEIGFNSIDIEPSNAVKPSIIQPYYTNIKMLKYIQERAKSQKYDDGYEFGTDISGNFFFKTISKIVEEAKTDVIAGRIPAFKLTPPNADPEIRIRDIVENQDILPAFFSFSGSEQFMSNTVSGAGGMSTAYFDFDTAEYVTEEVNYADFNTYQLADKTTLKETFADTSKIDFHGTNKDYKAITKSKVASHVSNYNYFRISTAGEVKLSISDIIELILPADPLSLATTGPLSEVYSGFYMIYGVEHRFDLMLNTYTTTLDLYRNGFNGKELNGHVTTKLGKFTK